MVFNRTKYKAYFNGGTTLHQSVVYYETIKIHYQGPHSNVYDII